MHRRALFIFLVSAVLTACLALTCVLRSGPTQAERIVERGLSNLGAPYVLGACGPDAFDCSGFVRWCLLPDGVELPHSAEEIGAQGSWASIHDLRRLSPGDILCFDTVIDDDPSDHVGIYMGGGAFVHASSAKGEVVVSRLEGYYLERFTCARRIAWRYF